MTSGRDEHEPIEPIAGALSLGEAFELARPDDIAPDGAAGDPAFAALSEALRNDARLAESLRRRVRFDARVRERFERVAVPSGLEARLLAAIVADSVAAAPFDQAVAGATTAAASEANAAVQPSGSERPSSRGWRRARRLWGAAAVAATLVGAAFFLFPWQVRERTPNDLASSALELWAAPGSHPAGQPLTRLPEAWALGRHAAAPLRSSTWRSVQAAGRTGVLVEWKLASGRAAGLLILPASGPDRIAPLANRPQSVAGASGGGAVAVWREGDLVYVLVAPGGEDDLRRMIRSGPLQYT
jgi:hypothetical protein